MSQPLVKLISLVPKPYDLAVATARTCYSAGGIVAIEDVSATPKARELRDKIADSTREAGHLTTRQHAHFVFAIDKVSRQFLWSFLHAHPYYNSEQVSQRYVKVAPGNFTIPAGLNDEQRAFFTTAVESQTADYRNLIELLQPEVSRRYFEIFPFRQKQADKYAKGIAKRAYEVARYVLPVATHAYLYHTISALTLMRYHRLCHAFETPAEAREVVRLMVEAVAAHDPEFWRELGDPLPLSETPEYKIFTETLTPPLGDERFVREFDDSLGDKTYSKLIDWKANAEATLAGAVRSVLGFGSERLNDDDALDRALDPKHNAQLTDTLNPMTLGKLSRTLHHAHYTFRKKISHTADSQDQRHRMVPGSRPILTRHYTGKPDYIVPLVVRENDQLAEAYQASLHRTFAAINALIDDGAAPEDALYLLPNAFPIRFEESGDLLNLHHKWKARSCYTAQEEIYFATLEELEQVRDVHPRIAKHILAPCYLRHRAGVTPYCPEGDRFCGVRVWKQDLSAYWGRSL